jgi:hypothetical protein
MQGAMMRWFIALVPIVFSVATLPAEEEKPSAALIVDAEETIIKEPALEPGEQALPEMDGNFPGEDNVFGDDLFGAPSGSAGSLSGRSAPRLPAAVPVLEDPLEAERKMRIRLAKIKARLDRDPRLMELEQMADTAPTPEDYRAARRAYYTLFFDKVRQADTTLKDFTEKLEKESLSGLFQTRIDPTWPLQEPPQPQPQAKFVPPRQYPDVLTADEEPVQLP